MSTPDSLVLNTEPEKVASRSPATTPEFQPNSLVPVLLGWLVIGAVTATVLAITMKNLGHWYYPLDDTYIGMSISKHLARFGVWGTSSRFASASSTPGFAVLLTVLYMVFGYSEYIPLATCLVCTFGCIYVSNRLFRGSSVLFRSAVTVLLAVMVPFSTMVLIGMEHALQILLCLIFLDWVLPCIVEKSEIDWKVLTVAALAVSVRYEDLFVVAGACFILLIQRRLKSLALLTAAAFLPVGAFGLYFRAHGGEWLPNSVLLKGGFNIYRIPTLIRYGPHMIFPMAIFAILAWRFRKRFDTRARASAIITAVALWLHFTFAGYGWVYRYEAYLIALAVISIGLIYAEQRVPFKFTVAVLLAAAFMFLHTVYATATIPERSRVFYTQQFQTMKLIQNMQVPTAVNDLGAATYFTDVPILDLVGLGSQDAFELRYKRKYTTNDIRNLVIAHHVQVIAIYANWFSTKPFAPWGGPPLPSEYVLIAKIYSPDPYRYASVDTVSYYAVPGSEGMLRTALEKLQPTMPRWDSLTFEPR
ncbi:MAG TPA: hypothetical protein VFE02_07460 [Candidatus Acidoferrales bacterium]|nr:hypothetical protein [Candidatus Acidoferrales bacterium]